MELTTDVLLSLEAPAEGAAGCGDAGEVPELSLEPQPLPGRPVCPWLQGSAQVCSSGHHFCSRKTAVSHPAACSVRFASFH